MADRPPRSPTKSEWIPHEIAHVQEFSLSRSLLHAFLQSPPHHVSYFTPKIWGCMRLKQGPPLVFGWGRILDHYPTCVCAVCSGLNCPKRRRDSRVRVCSLRGHFYGIAPLILVTADWSCGVSGGELQCFRGFKRWT